jgi:hypothetical protein
MTDDDSTAEEKQPEPIEFYRIALETRNLEISLFWQRSNYFLVLSTAIAVGVFSLSNPLFSIVLSGFGIVISLLWFRINLGSKFWQSRWEQRLREVEEASFGKEIKFFATSGEDIRSDVRKNLNLNGHTWLRARLFDRLVLTKPSVSFVMMLLPIVFMLFWGFVVAAHLLGWVC